MNIEIGKAAGRVIKTVAAYPFYFIGWVVGWIFAAIRFVVKAVVLGFRDAAKV